MYINTAETIYIEKSIVKLIGLMIAADVMTAFSIALIFDLHWWNAIGYTGLMRKMIGYIGAIFFGLCGVGILWRLLTQKGAVLTLSPQGIRDTRVAREMLPWPAVLGVSTWGTRGSKFVVLSVDPSAEQRLTLTRMARLGRNANARLGADGLCITASGLKMNFDELHALIRAYSGK